MEAVDPQTYRSWSYNTKERLCSFWHQADEVRRLGAMSVVEVGIGSGLVAGWLRDRGVQVTTVDVDPALEPDLCASVTDLPVDDGRYDAALCCEVLEHLHFEDVVPALRELARVARLGVVVSVPDDRPFVGTSYPLYFGMYVDMLRRRYPLRRSLAGALLRRQVRLRDAAFLAFMPERWSRGDAVLTLEPPPVPHSAWRHDFDGAHHWELGTEGFPVERLTAAFADAGLQVVRDFRVAENPWHHFWTLRPR